MLAPILKLIKGTRTLVQAQNFLKYKLSSPREVLNYAPIVLSVSPTDRCNLHCDMCLTHSQMAAFNKFRHEPAPDMSLDMFKEIVDRFSAALSVQIIGTGEPILNKDYFEMVAYAAGVKKMDVFTTSNGTILADKIDLIVHSRLSELLISLNGHNEAEFQRLTGQSSKYYQRICDNIRALIAAKKKAGSAVKIGVSFILDKDNYRFINEMITQAEALGVDMASFGIFLSPVEVPGYTAAERSLFEDDEDVRRVLSQRKHPRSNMNVIVYPLLKHNPPKRCRVFFTNLRVDGAGSVGACSRMILNLADNGHFTDKGVWNNEYFRRMRRVYLDPAAPLPEPCRVCPSNSIAEGAKPV